MDRVTGTFVVSCHRLVKIVHDLGRSSYLDTRCGILRGICPALPAERTRVGDIVLLGEATETVTECVDGERRSCRVSPCFRVKGVLDAAALASFEGLDRHSPADLLRRPSRMHIARDL